MAPFFTFFVDKKESGYVTPFIRKLDPYYPSFADAIYITPMDMKKRYSGSNAKFFAYDNQDLIMFDLESVDMIEPLVAVTMDSSTKMNRISWMKIFKFLQAVFEQFTVPDDILKDVQEIIPPVKISAEKISLLKSEDEVKKQPEEYEFNYVVEDDICYCQITKPYTDKPYTCVIRDYFKTGFEPLFTALYVCQSWGVTNLDHVFLHQLWTHLNMQGELNIESRLAQEIELCKNGKPEPEVYRLDISGVKEQLSRKQKRRSVHLDPAKFQRL
jgi:hypothetical protein